MGYIVLRKVEMLEGKITCRGSFNYNVIYIADDKSTVSNISGKIEINEVIERDNITSDMEYMLYPEVEHVDCTIKDTTPAQIIAVFKNTEKKFHSKI